MDGDKPRIVCYAGRVFPPGYVCPKLAAGRPLDFTTPCTLCERGPGGPSASSFGQVRRFSKFLESIRDTEVKNG